MAKVARNDRMDADFPSQGTVYDLSGLEVDATGWVWNSIIPSAAWLSTFVVFASCLARCSAQSQPLSRTVFLQHLQITSETALIT